MNRNYVTNYEYAAEEFAKEIHLNDEKKEYFLKGAQWAFGSIISTMNNAGHPLANDSENRMMKERAWKDVKKSIQQLMERKI